MTNSMENNEYHIETVEFYYNDNNEMFNMFLKSIIRDYISEDKISPNAEENKVKKSA